MIALGSCWAQASTTESHDFYVPYLGSGKCFFPNSTAFSWGGDFCVIPSFNFTIAYVFTGPLSQPLSKGFREMLRLYESFLRPSFISLGGGEWDLLKVKWTTRASFELQVREKIITLRSAFPYAMFFLRNNYAPRFAIGRASHAAMQSVLLDLATENITTKKDNDDCLRDLKRRIHMLDLRMLIGSRAPSKRSVGWTDGLHPNFWVIYQFVSLCANLMSDLSRHCPRPVRSHIQRV